MAARKSGPLLAPVVLLIGTTGSGKSTLGNFLLNPDHTHITTDQTFPTARSNRPETKRVQCASDNRDNPTIQVIDTPGLNEHEHRDLSHMKDVVKTLRGLHYVSACILCVKFNATIDMQWKATVAYYKSLFPMLFEGNVVIVMTDYQTYPHLVRLREMQQIDVDDVTRNVLSEVTECAGITYKPQVFRIDSLPVDEFENARQQSESDRSAIISYIQASLKPVDVSDLMVAKTDALKRKDAAEIVRLDGEIHGYNQRLWELKTSAEPVLVEIEAKENEISQVDHCITTQKAELADKDSTVTVIAEQWSVKEKWKLFRWQSKPFECVSKWPIAEHITWDNGHLKWKDLNVEGCRATGRVEGKFMRGLYASLTLETHKRDKYTEKISELRASLELNESLLTSLESDLQQVKESGKKEHENEIDLLMRYIHERKERKMAISSSYLTLEQAERRLWEL